MVDLTQKPAAKFGVHVGAEEMPYPDPRQRSKGNFKRAGPVDSSLEWVVRPPMFQLANNLITVNGPAGHDECLGQQDQVLMAVDLPNPLVIAGSLGIDVGH